MFKNVIETNLNKILAQRHYLIAEPAGEISADDVASFKSKTAYLNAFLLSNYGIVVDKPFWLRKSHIETIDNILHLNVPHSFYANPQDMKYFTKSELLIEQLVSYLLVESGTGCYDRPEIFKKDLPEYAVGDTMKLREFKIVDGDEVTEVAKSIYSSLCAYTRPFNLEEKSEFVYLYRHGFATEDAIKCRDNIFELLDLDIRLARFLDKKDLVKYSIKEMGEQKVLSSVSKETVEMLRGCLSVGVRNCPMSKKQAKYYNKIVAMCGMSKVVKSESNERSPYKAATAALKAGDVLKAAEVYSKSGSLLERNLVMLLSRANPIEAGKILDMVPAKNPIALFQMTNNLASKSGANRTFTFTKNNKVKRHIETKYEATWRKSRLNDSTKKLVHDICFDKIGKYYQSLETLGKVYIDDRFFKIGVPSNTSAMGKGMDVLPAGSRIAVRSGKVRSFVRWKDIHDIDASLICIKDDGTTDIMYFGNYHSLPFSDAVFFSGDDRSDRGSEFYDIDIKALRAKGYRYAVQTFHGFCSKLNNCEVICGFMIPDDFKTRAWDSKNIEMQFRALGDTHACLGFAIDLETSEAIMLNQMVENDHNVVSGSDKEAIMKYLDPSFMELNIGYIVSNRGTVVDTPEEADVVFADTYTPTETQKVIRSYELEKLVAVANGANNF